MASHVTRHSHRNLSERQQQIKSCREDLDAIQERFHHAMSEIRRGQPLSHSETNSVFNDCVIIHDFRSQMALDPSPIPFTLAPQINNLYDEALLLEKQLDNKCLRTAMLVTLAASATVCFLGAVLSGAELIKKYY